MIRQLGYIFTGLVLAIALFVLFGSAFAVQPNLRFPTATPEITEPPVVITFPPPPTTVVDPPTATFEAVFPTATIQPGSTVTAVPPKGDDPKGDKSKSKKSTPSPTLVLLVESEDCTNSCLCLIVTQLAVGNDLQRTAIAADMQACSQP